MNSEQAMKNVAIAAAQLSVAKDYAAKYDDQEAREYLNRVKESWRVAVQQYTDPFRSRTYA